MSLVTLVLKSLEGGVRILERDIESASNKIVKLNAEHTKVAANLATKISYYKELIAEAEAEHVGETIRISAVIAAQTTRRAVAIKLKNSITKLLNGDV